MSDKDVERVYHLVGLLDRITNERLVKKGTVGLTDHTRKKAVEATIAHHTQFVDRFIHQKSVDPFKIISWYGFFLTQHADDPDRRILEVAITHLNDLLGLKQLKLKLSASQLRHLYQMARLDGFEDEFGVGKNGIYSVFSSCLDLTNEYGNGGYIVRPA